MVCLQSCFQSHDMDRGVLSDNLLLFLIPMRLDAAALQPLCPWPEMTSDEPWLGFLPRSRSVELGESGKTLPITSSLPSSTLSEVWHTLVARSLPCSRREDRNYIPEV